MKISVVDKTNNSPLASDVQVSVTVDGFFEHCTHAHQNIEVHQVNDGTDDEYDIILSVCQKCGAGWDADGELRLEADCGL